MKYYLDKNNRGNKVSPLLYGASGTIERDPRPSFFRFEDDYEKNIRLCEESGVLPLPVFVFGTLPVGSKKIKSAADKIASVLFYAKGDENSSIKEEYGAARKRVLEGRFEPYFLDRIVIDSPSKKDILFELSSYDLEESTNLLEKFNVSVLDSVSVNSSFAHCLNALSMKREIVHLTDAEDELSVAALLLSSEKNAKMVDVPSQSAIGKLYAKRLGTSCLTNVVPSSHGVKGGISIGAEKTTFLLKTVLIRALDGTVRYFHSFREGKGDWIGGCEETKDGLIIRGATIVLFEDFGECEVEVEAKRLLGDQNLVIGVGVSEGCGSYLSYGKNQAGYQVLFEKKLFGEIVETKSFASFEGYSKEGNHFKLTFTKESLSSSVYRLGKWHDLFAVSSVTLEDRVFVGATFIEDDIVYLKIVNTKDEVEEAEITLNHFGEKTKATFESNAERKEVSIKDNALTLTIPSKTACVITIE